MTKTLNASYVRIVYQIVAVFITQCNAIMIRHPQKYTTSLHTVIFYLILAISLFNNIDFVVFLLSAVGTACPSYEHM